MKMESNRLFEEIPMNAVKIEGSRDYITLEGEVVKFHKKQENTQKAFDDGLVKNAKGYDDSQSKPVIQYDLQGNEVVRFGFILE